VENFHPREIWSGASGSRFPAVYPKAGEKRNWGGVAIEFLSPPAGYVPATNNRNNDSLAFRITYGESSFLFTGDIERPMELRMLAAGLLKPSDVLKVAHHGSKTSTLPQFLDAVRPRLALISDGEGNLFRHPHPSVVERLEQRGTRIFRTDLHGQITIRTDGRHWSVETFRLRNR
jgi:competence protein ComEC